MSSLSELLKDTVFFRINNRHTEHGVKDAVSAKTKTWEWSLDVEKNPTIDDLSCLTDAGDWPSVLEALLWQDPVVYTDTLSGVRLTLGKEFILKIFSAGDAEIHDLPGLLDESAESSMQIVYGFQYFPGNHTVKPLIDASLENTEALESDDFFKTYFGEFPPFEEKAVGGHRKMKVHLRAVKFLFVAELICCTPNNRFEPTGVGRVARFYPRSYLMANVPFRLSEAVTHMSRPAHAQHAHGQHDHSDANANANADASDGASHEYHGGYYTDSNISVLLQGDLLPKWPNFFSYYSHDDRRKYHVVKSKQLTERSDSTNLLILKDKGLQPYVYAKVLKMPRQGAFDNLHIAPAMIAPAVIRKIRQSGSAGASWKSLDNIHMAPVCHHDCFHLHWRWGAALHMPFEVRHLKGWGADGPYQEIGAPMIPKNQDLYVECPETNQVVYRVEIEDEISPLRWQVFMDHGAGYMVGLEEIVWCADLKKCPVKVVMENTRRGTADVEPKVNDASWAMFYWNMRYANVSPLGGGQSTPMERMLFSDEQLRNLVQL